jgi:hypothetical protein
VSDATFGAGIYAFTPIVEPAIPSIIVTINKVSNIF